MPPIEHGTQGIGSTAADRHLADAIAAYWTNFARSADPNGPGLPHWPRYQPGREELLRLGTKIRAQPMTDLAPLERIGRIYAIHSAPTP